jgi:hypothetical protein
LAGSGQGRVGAFPEQVVQGLAQISDRGRCGRQRGFSVKTGFGPVREAFAQVGSDLVTEISGAGQVGVAGEELVQWRVDLVGHVVLLL